MYVDRKESERIQREAGNIEAATMTRKQIAEAIAAVSAYHIYYG